MMVLIAQRQRLGESQRQPVRCRHHQDRGAETPRVQAELTVPIALRQRLGERRKVKPQPYLKCEHLVTLAKLLPVVLVTDRGVKTNRHRLVSCGERHHQRNCIVDFVQAPKLGPWPERVHWVVAGTSTRCARRQSERLAAGYYARDHDFCGGSRTHLDHQTYCKGFGEAGKPTSGCGVNAYAAANS